MWSPEDLNFASDRIASIFLLSSWHELFYSFTPDSNQPRLHNTASLIEELNAIAELWQFNSRYQSHANIVQSELKEVLGDEVGILRTIPEYQSCAKHLVDETSPVAIRSYCKLLNERKELYDGAVLAHSRKTILELPEKKDAPHKSIRRVATLAFQRGKEDNDVWDPLSKNAAASHSEIIDEIITLTTAAGESIECTLAVAAHPHIHAAIRMSGLRLVSCTELPAEYIDSFSESTEELLFVRTAVEATSIRHAVAMSRKRLGIASGLVSLYQNSSIPVYPIALVSYKGAEIIFSQAEQAFRRLYPRTNPSQDIREAVKKINENVEDRLVGAIELLSLAAASSDARARLINFWSSLETLAGAHEAKTTLERVSGLVVPLVISRHVGRSSRYLAIATQQFGASVVRNNYGAGFPKSTAKFVAPTEMLKTLVSPKDSDPIVQLLAFAEHPLLRYRIHRSWKTYHDPKALLKMLQNSKSRLSRHLARIYRARNSLVHEGIESPFLVPLLDNLQNYVSMAVQRLIHETKLNPAWTVRDVIAFWQWKMQHQLSSLEQHSAVLCSADFIDTHDREPLWPA